MLKLASQKPVCESCGHEDIVLYDVNYPDTPPFHVCSECKSLAEKIVS